MAAAGSPWIPLPILSISSIKNNGFILLALIIDEIILPGIAPTYVFLCPVISFSSETPPTEILTKFLLSALAIEYAKDVLPTPGGPTKHIIGLVSELVNFLTEIYSRILSLIFSSPLWFSSNTSLIESKFSSSKVYSPKGIDNNVSI